MAFLSVFIGWLHVMFAVIAVGGGIFNLFVLGSALKGISPETAGKIAMEVGLRFTKLVWISIGGLAITGIIRVALDSSFAHAFGFDSDYGVVMNIKMLFFIGIIIHAFLITMSGKKMGETAAPEERMALQKRIRTFSLTNTILAIVVIFLAVGLRFGGSLV